MIDLDNPDPVMRPCDFHRRFRFRMVKAYPVVSEVPDVYEADHDQIDAGFTKCLENRHLRRVARLYLDERAAPKRAKP